MEMFTLTTLSLIELCGVRRLLVDVPLERSGYHFYTLTGHPKKIISPGQHSLQ